jgi:hypothetical protein
MITGVTGEPNTRARPGARLNRSCVAARSFE